MIEYKKSKAKMGHDSSLCCVKVSYIKLWQDSGKCQCRARRKPL